ncbi:Kazal-type serine protease inhibitor domain protein, partial [Ostertagia ostertagi]
MYLLAVHLVAVLLLAVRRSLAEECAISQTTRSYLNETFFTSQVLLSGTVEKITLISEKEDVVQHLQVRIRRVFKGKEHLKSSSSVDVIVPSSFKFCISVLLVHDTRVFPLTSDGKVPYTFCTCATHQPQCIGLTSLIHFNGKCECRSYCRQTGPAVCGSDRVSYASACHLFVRACLLAKKGISLRMVGREAC